MSNTNHSTHNPLDAERILFVYFVVSRLRFHARSDYICAPQSPTSSSITGRDFMSNHLAWANSKRKKFHS